MIVIDIDGSSGRSDDGFLKRTIICIDKEFPSYNEQNSHIN